ncbi:MAG: NAD(P)H-hydrate dehydratase [Acidobacteria bacterium]|nr:NAD(P)H-hydrate dehydratase [Acidobacteriota bacterium]
MIPLVSVEVMRDSDRRAVARYGGDALVRAAGEAVAAQARQMLGTLYGRRIAVIVGPGLNGADGRVAARNLRARGCRVDVVTVARQPRELPYYDLVIDAAFGLGCRRAYEAPHLDRRTKVLAVDLPSGVDADTGRLLGRPARADVTLALGALKFAHVDGPAAELTGELRFADLGIGAPTVNAMMTDADLGGFVRGRRDDHKWSHALSVLAGSPLMPGAAALVCQGALSAGASMIRLESMGKIAKLVALSPEVVRVRGPLVDPRSRCVVAGPGLGAASSSWLRERLEETSVTAVLDADALTPAVVSLSRRAPRVLTPHAGEFARLTGDSSTSERIGAVRTLAAHTESVVLLKGPVTIISSAQGHLRVVTAGTNALATAGTGDILAGMIGAAIARGHEPFDAAALSAHLHARAGATLRPYEGATALAAAVTRVLGALAGDS